MVNLWVRAMEHVLHFFKKTYEDIDLIMTQTGHPIAHPYRWAMEFFLLKSDDVIVHILSMLTYVIGLLQQHRAALK